MFVTVDRFISVSVQSNNITIEPVRLSVGIDTYARALVDAITYDNYCKIIFYFFFFFLHKCVDSKTQKQFFLHKLNKYFKSKSILSPSQETHRAVGSPKI